MSTTTSACLERPRITAVTLAGIIISRRYRHSGLEAVHHPCRAKFADQDHVAIFVDEARRCGA